MLEGRYFLKFTICVVAPSHLAFSCKFFWPKYASTCGDKISYAHVDAFLGQKFLPNVDMLPDTVTYGIPKITEVLLLFVGNKKIWTLKMHLRVHIKFYPHT